MKTADEHKPSKSPKTPTTFDVTKLSRNILTSSSPRGYQITATFDTKGNMVELDVTRGNFLLGEVKRGVPGYVYDSVEMIRESRQIKQLREEMINVEARIKAMWQTKGKPPFFRSDSEEVVSILEAAD